MLQSHLLDGIENKNRDPRDYIQPDDLPRMEDRNRPSETSLVREGAPNRVAEIIGSNATETAEINFDEERAFQRRPFFEVQRRDPQDYKNED